MLYQEDVIKYCYYIYHILVFFSTYYAIPYFIPVLAYPDGCPSCQEPKYYHIRNTIQFMLMMLIYIISKNFFFHHIKKIIIYLCEKNNIKSKYI